MNERLPNGRFLPKDQWKKRAVLFMEQLKREPVDGPWIVRGRVIRWL